MEMQLQFKFKGSRNYVQGPDIFNAISQEFQARSGGWIKQLRFGSLLKNNAKLLIGSDLLNYNKKILSATGVASAYGEKGIPFSLLPLDNSLIFERYEYNEQEIIDKLSFCEEDKSIELAAQTPYSLIEEAVAAVKELNNQLATPPPDRKWLFTGINLNKKLPPNRSGLALKTICRQIIANRFSRNELYMDSHLLGVIEFTLGNL